jgi:hypothetical protein
MNFDLDLRGRNCDRAVERSPSLEAVDQLPTLLLRDSLEVKLQADSVEQADVWTGWLAAILKSLDGHVDRLHRQVLIFGYHLDQLHAAGSDSS